MAKRKIVGEDGKEYKVKKKGGCLKNSLFIILGLAVLGAFIPKDEDTKTNVKDNSNTTEMIETTEAETTEQTTIETTEKTTTTEATTEATTISREEEIAMIKEQEAHSLTWEEMMRNPEEHMFKYVITEGEALVVQNDTETTFIQLLYNSDVNQPIIIEIPREDLDQNVLKGDYITVYGTYIQQATFTTVLGEQVESPQILADLVEIH